jgi:hypothetical protein
MSLDNYSVVKLNCHWFETQPPNQQSSDANTSSASPCCKERTFTALRERRQLQAEDFRVLLNSARRANVQLPVQSTVSPAKVRTAADDCPHSHNYHGVFGLSLLSGSRGVNQPVAE